jgi:hypothetical protein
MTSPSLAVFSDNQFIDEMHRRLATKAISVEFITGGENYAQIRVVAGINGSRYGFSTIALEEPLQK